MNRHLVSSAAGRCAHRFGLLLAVLATAVFSTCLPAFAATVDFDNDAADNDWNNALNWSNLGVDGLPTIGDDARVNFGVAGTPGSGANISGALTNPQVDRVIVGDAGTGVVTQTDGAITTTLDTIIGSGAGNVGEYYISGGSHTAASGFMYVGTGGGSGLVDQSGTGTVTVASGELHIGQGVGSLGTYNLAGGNLTDSGWTYVGLDGGTGTMVQAAGTTFTAGGLDVGQGAGSTGTYTNNGGTINLAGDLSVGRGGGTGTFNQNGGDIIDSTNPLWIGVEGGSNGTFNQNGGNVTSMASDTRIGFSGGTGTYNLNAGNLTTNVNSGWTFVGSDGGTGFMTQAAGTTFTTAGLDVGQGAGATGTYTQNGGTLTVNGGDLSVGRGGGTGTYTQNGGDVINTTGPIWTGVEGGSNGTYTLNAGNITLGREIRVGGNGGTGTFNQNGGNVTSERGDTTIGVDGGTGTYNLNAGNLSTNTADNWTFVGLNGGSNGTFHMGPGAGTFSTGGWLSVGRGGNGTFIQDGGTLRVPAELTISDGGGSTGLFVLNNGRVDHGGTGNWLDVGRDNNGDVSDGRLEIHGGQFTSTPRGVVGWASNGRSATGTVIVDGGTGHAFQELWIGSGDNGISGDGSGTGTMSVSGPASVTVDFGTLGVGQGGGNGTFNQSGGTITVRDGFHVGADQDSVGVYNMSGGTLSQPNLPGDQWNYIGRANTTGNATFLQTGGLVEFDDRTHVGFGATGLLDISNGGVFRVKNHELTIGDDLAGNGTVIVRDPGTTLSTSAALIVGHWDNGTPGSGIMNVSTGATVNVGTELIVNNRNAYGQLDISDPGTTVTANSMEIHHNPDYAGNGVVNVRNSATLTINNHARIGRTTNGTGTLNIDTGASVTILNATNPGVWVGDDAGAKGYVNVTDGNLTVMGSEFTLGQRGYGEMNLSSTGNVFAAGNFNVGGDTTDQTPTDTGIMRQTGTSTLTANVIQVGGATDGQILGSYGEYDLAAGATATAISRVDIGSGRFGRMGVEGTLNSPETRVQSNGVLHGTGTVSGKVQVEVDGRLTPGNGNIGTINVGNLRIEGGGNLWIELGAPGSSDMVNVTDVANASAVDFSDLPFFVGAINVGGMAASSYKIIDYDPTSGVADHPLVGFGGPVLGNMLVGGIDPNFGYTPKFGDGSVARPDTSAIYLDVVAGSEWIGDTGGGILWGTAANWDTGAAPIGVDAVAKFLGGAVGAGSSVTVAALTTVGRINLANTGPASVDYTISGAPLLMDVSTGAAAIEAYSGNHTINNPLIMPFNNLLITAAPGASLTLNGTITQGAALPLQILAFGGGGTINTTGDITVVGADPGIGYTPSAIALDQGTLNQNGGVVTSDVLYIGVNDTSTYNLNSGTLVIADIEDSDAYSILNFRGGTFVPALPGATHDVDQLNVGTAGLPGSHVAGTIGENYDAHHSMTIGDGPGTAGSSFTIVGGQLRVNDQQNDLGRAPLTVGRGGGDGTLNITGTASVLNYQDLLVGSGAGSTGTVNHDSGSYFSTTGAAANTGGWVFVGQGGGTGTYNLSGTGTLNNVNSNGGWIIAGTDGGSVGNFNQSGTSDVKAGTNWTGANGGTGTYVMSGSSTAYYNNDVYVGVGGGGSTGAFEIHDNAVLTMDPTAAVNPSIRVGVDDGATGTFLQTDSASVSTFWVGLGVNNNTVGTYTMTGGTLTTGKEFMAGMNGTAQGTMNQSSGQVDVGGWLMLGGRDVNQTATVGNYNLTGDAVLNVGVDPAWAATPIVNANDFGNDVFIGDFGTSTFTIDDTAVANFNVGLTGTTKIGNHGPANGGAAIGVLNVNGGTVNANTDMILGYDAGASGTVTQTDGAVNVAGQLVIGKSGLGVYSAGSGATGGTLDAGFITAGGEALSNGTLNVDGTAAVTVGADTTIGLLGTGTYNQTGGSLSTGGFTVGGGVGGVGTANLNGAGSTLTVATNLIVGSNGNGTMTQIDGTASVAGSLLLGEGGASVGSYTMIGGLLTVAGDGNVGIAGTATMSQTGGIVRIGDLGLGTGDLNVGTAGQYTLSGISDPLNPLTPRLIIGNNLNATNILPSDRFSMTGGILTVGGTLDFTQDGGLLDVTGTLPGSNTEILVEYRLNAGTASINGGNTLLVSGDIFNGGGAGTINVGTTSSGTLTVTGTADVDTVNLRNGTVTTAGLTVGNATATATNGASTINGPVTLASGGTINVAAGSLGLTGVLNTSNGTIGGAGTLNANGGFSVAAGGLTVKNGTGTTNVAGPQSHGVGAVLTTSAGTTNLNSDANGNLTVNANAATNFGSTTHLQGVTVGGGATATITSGGSKVLVTGGVGPIAGQLDVTNNDMIVQATAGTRVAVLASVTGFLTTGSNGFTWTGNGINSSTAAADASLLTAVGVMLNDDGFGGPFYTSFSGQPADANSILVKYTYYGDGDLSGSVDGTDYALIDNGFNASLTGWFNGDFDYSGVVDGTDYALIDNAFNSQGGPLGGGVAAVPEPGTVGLFALGGLALLALRRRRKA